MNYAPKTSFRRFKKQFYTDDTALLLQFTSLLCLLISRQHPSSISSLPPQPYPITAPMQNCSKCKIFSYNIYNSSADKDLEVIIKRKLILTSDGRGTHLSNLFNDKMRVKYITTSVHL